LRQIKRSLRITPQAIDGGSELAQLRALIYDGYVTADQKLTANIERRSTGSAIVPPTAKFFLPSRL
jgi:hypothetical protein